MGEREDRKNWEWEDGQEPPPPGAIFSTELGRYATIDELLTLAEQRGMEAAAKIGDNIAAEKEPPNTVKYYWTGRSQGARRTAAAIRSAITQLATIDGEKDSL